MLKKSTSPKAFKENIKTEIKAGKPVKQAVAIAYAEKNAAQKAKAKKWQTRNAQLVDLASTTLCTAKEL